MIQILQIKLWDLVNIKSQNNYLKIPNKIIIKLMINKMNNKIKLEKLIKILIKF
jgi:hypothetical protein